VTRALEQAPNVTIPADFAARVAAQVPVRPLVRCGFRAMGCWRRRLAWACWYLPWCMAMHSTGRGVFGIALEWVLCAELVALAVWLAARRDSSFPMRKGWQSF